MQFVCENYTHTHTEKKSDLDFKSWIRKITIPMLSSIITKFHMVPDMWPTSLCCIWQFSASFLYHRQFLFTLYFARSFNLSSTFGSSSALRRISLKQWLIKSQHSFKDGSKTILGSSTLSLTISIWGTKNFMSWYGSVKSLPSLGKKN